MRTGSAARLWGRLPVQEVVAAGPGYAQGWNHSEAEALRNCEMGVFAKEN
jgi:hypothetical protein